MVEGDFHYHISTHARGNLLGALIDLERYKADEICLGTIRAVLKQLAEIEKILKLPTDDGWQPIGTVPQDRTIDILTKFGRLTSVRLDGDHRWYRDTEDGEIEIYPNPTHWMWQPELPPNP